jgi:hypothetical protein
LIVNDGRVNSGRGVIVDVDGVDVSIGHLDSIGVMKGAVIIFAEGVLKGVHL